MTLSSERRNLMPFSALLLAFVISFVRKSKKQLVHSICGHLCSAASGCCKQFVSKLISVVPEHTLRREETTKRIILSAVILPRVFQRPRIGD